MAKRVIILALASALALPALADLCNVCRGGMYTADIGKCVNCGGQTTSGAFALCPQCSRQLGQCEHCRKPLSPSATTKPTTRPTRGM